MSDSIVKLHPKQEMWSPWNLLWRSYFVAKPGSEILLDYSYFTDLNNDSKTGLPIEFLHIEVTDSDGNRYRYDVELKEGEKSVVLNSSTMRPTRAWTADKEELHPVYPFEVFTPGSQLLVDIGVKEDNENSYHAYLMAVGYVSGKKLPPRFVLFTVIFPLLWELFKIPLTLLRFVLFKKL